MSSPPESLRFREFRNVTRETVLGRRIETASTFGSKLKGLMFRAELKEGAGLFLENVASIHMCFMRFPIDALFLDKSLNVTSVSEKLTPWISIAADSSASHVLELPAGTVRQTDTRPGDRLEIR